MVRERRRAHHGRQQRVVLTEPLGPRRLQRGPLAVAAQPVAVAAGELVGGIAGAHRHGGADEGEEQRRLRRRVDRRADLLDLGAGRAMASTARAQHVEHRPIARALGIVEPHRDAPPGDRRRAGRRQLDAPRRPARRLRPGQHRHQQVEVAGAAGHRPEHVDVGVGGAAADAVEVAALGHDAVARLEAERAAAVRRQPHRAADVGAELERRQARPPPPPPDRPTSRPGSG